jgi:hypothetical protein
MPGANAEVDAAPEGEAMMRLVGIVLAAVLWCGCSNGDKYNCSQGSPARCVNNVLEVCFSNWFQTGLYTYLPVETCSAPQVCKVDTAGPGVNLTGENGCFASDADCPSVGWSECVAQQYGPTDQIYACALRASDQTLRWSVSDCRQLVPKSICAIAIAGDSGSAACLEVVENCPGPPASPGLCDGNDQLNCFMSIVDNKAVYDWTRTSCSDGAVCRVLYTGFAYCVNP